MAVNSVLRPIVNLGRLIKATVSLNRFYGATASNIIKSPYPHVQIPEITIPEMVFSKIGKWGNHVATECPISGRKYTYDQLRQYVENLSGALRKKLKLNKGDIVAMLLPNCPEYPIVTLGILRGGMTATPLNPLYTSEEISRQLSDSGAKALITTVDLWPIAKAATDLTRQSLPILTANTKEGQLTPEGAISLREVIQEKVDTSDISLPNPDDIALMPYSSGTTGLPKGVQLTHANIVSNLYQMSLPDIDYYEETTNNHQDVVPSILPSFHVYGFILTMLLPVTKGCKNVSLAKFEPKSFTEILSKYKPDLLFLAPPLVLFMITQDIVKPDHLASIRNIVSGGAPLGATDEDALLAKAKKNIIIGQVYGMTETSPVITLSKKNTRAVPGSAGTAVANTELKIVDISDPLRRSLGPNQTGELLVRGPQIMKGYYNRSEANRDTLVDGWIKTGDIARCDEGGNLTITDRIKELIKVKGFQVAPAELEGVLREYPDVTEAGVIGIPHERYGEVPRAYVSLKPGVQLNDKKLQEFVKSKVASYKELKGGISIMKSIPKTASGKLLRRQLKEYYEKYEK